MKTGVLAFVVSVVVTGELYWLAKLVTPAGDVWQFLAQATGLFGILLLAWTYVLAIRHRSIEQAFGGLDIVYRWHHMLGGSAFLLIMHHPLLLMIRALPRNTFSLYFLPSGVLSYTLGIIAFYCLLVLIILTLFVDLPYKIWKQTHEWMGMVIILGAWHGLTVPSDVSRFVPLGWWIGGISFLAVLAFLYKRYLYYIVDPGTKTKIKTIQRENDITLITLVSDDEKRGLPVYKPGQFAFLSFSMRGDRRDEHPFSVVAQEGDTITFGVKVTGGFTLRLAQSDVGTYLIVRGPYGSFGMDKSSVPNMLWVAGGIGVTPFMSLLKSLHPSQQLTFIITARGAIPALLWEPIATLISFFPGATLIHHDSQKAGRLTAEKIRIYTPLHADTHVWLCGPQPLMESLSEQLPNYGVLRHRIHFEDFRLK